MNRTYSCTILGLLAAGWLVAAPPAASDADSSKRPNVLVILADDLGYGDVGFQGCKDIPTPNLDALAKEAVRCTSGYVSCPYCSPTRAGLMTGRYQQRFGHEFNPEVLAHGGAGQGLAPAEVTVAARLQAAGYATGLIGKWHLGEEEKFHPLKRGFGEFFGFLPGAHSYLQTDDKNYGPIYRGRQRVAIDGHLTDVLTREALSFIDRHRAGPFFLYLAFNAVHTPLQATDPLLKKVAHIANPTRRTYAALTAGLDEAVGKVLGKLRTAGLDENTLVFFLSDNGGPIGKFTPNGSTNGPLRGSKGDTWEGGIRVPFLVRWKGRLPAGKVYNHPVIQLDIHPTALAAVGIAVKPAWKLDGVNLLPFLSGKDAAAPHAALYWRFGEQMAIRAGDWKLVRPDLSAAPFGKIADKPMLFNLARDIGENTDLAGKEPALVKRLSRQWQQWNTTLASPAWQHHSLQRQPGRRLAPFFRPPPELARDLGSYRSPLQFADGHTVKGAAEWPKRRQEILKTWHAFMGPWPALIEKPRMETLTTEHRESFTQHHIRLEIAPGRTTEDAYLLVPDGKGPFPAVVVVFYDTKTGIGQGKAKLRDFAYQLAKRGFVALSLGSPPASYYPDKTKAQLQPLSFHAYMAANCYNALAALPQVDPKRVGIVGHSYGGKWAMFASCLYDKFACAAWSDGGVVFDEKRPNVNYWEPWYLGYEAGRERKPGIPTGKNPRTGAYKELVETGHDLHELHALMAPRPFLVSGGSEDRSERWGVLTHAIAVNRLLGFENRVAMTTRKGHDPTEASNEQLYLFMEWALKGISR